MMKDTSPEIERLMREKMITLSGAQRVRMAAEMFESARRIILASFPPDLSEEEVRRRLFERIYAEELRAGKVESPWEQKPSRA
jgi:Lon protease-like protein